MSPYILNLFSLTLPFSLRFLFFFFFSPFFPQNSLSAPNPFSLFIYPFFFPPNLFFYKFFSFSLNLFYCKFFFFLFLNQFLYSVYPILSLNSQSISAAARITKLPLLVKCRADAKYFLLFFKKCKWFVWFSLQLQKLVNIQKNMCSSWRNQCYIKCNVCTLLMENCLLTAPSSQLHFFFCGGECVKGKAKLSIQKTILHEYTTWYPTSLSITFNLQAHGMILLYCDHNTI